MFTMKNVLIASLASGVSADAEAGQWNWNQMTSSRSFNGPEDYSTFKSFDTTYMMALVGENGQDSTVLHKAHHLPKVGLTSMEKVVAMTSASTRASIRKQLVSLLKMQVRIESMYGTKKEKLYQSASSVYNFISRLLHSACTIALSNDGLWKEQMQCFSAYRQLLEVYSMWNGIRDIAFALEHGMSVTPENLAVCGPNAAMEDNFVSQDPSSQRLQNQYLVSATMRACYDNLQVRIEALRRWLSSLLVSMDSAQDRGESCLFRVITVLTCLSSGNQENVLDLAIKEEHKQHTVYSMARYASVVLKDASSGTGKHGANTGTTTSMGANATSASNAPSASLIQVEEKQNLREIRKTMN